MSTQRLTLRQHALYFVALGGSDPVVVTVGVSCSPITEGVRKTQRLRREAVLWFAPIGTLSRATVALGSLRSRMRQWPAQDGWYLIPVEHGRTFRRSFGAVVENYSQLDTRSAIQSVDLKDYSPSRSRPDLTFTAAAAAMRRKPEKNTEV